MTATYVYAKMREAVRFYTYARRSEDPNSPQKDLTMEASAGETFVLSDVKQNVPTNAHVDLRWARANALHFFSCTEEAGVLRKYNKHADRFLVGDAWPGAYGAIAMPQVRDCVTRLRASPDTRRAIVSMGDGAVDDINRPACWSFLHFLKQDKLHMLVYQRSLNLRVMPYDCVVLTNVLLHVANETDLPVGSLKWIVGSLHATETTSHSHDCSSLLLDYETMRNEKLAWEALNA